MTPAGRAALVLAGLVLAPIVLGAGAAAEEAIPIAAPKLRETYRSGVPVSGEVRVGVVAGESQATGAESLTLRVLVPEEEGEAAEARKRKADGSKLCVKLTSRDGRYEGQAEVALSGDGPVYVLDIRSEHMDVLREHGKELYLAPLVTLVAEDGSCGGRPDAILLASWGVGVPRDKFSVLVNSGGLETTIIGYRPDRSTERFPCETIAEKERVTFDRRCDVDVSGDDFVRFAVRRREAGSFVRLPLPIER